MPAKNRLKTYVPDSYYHLYNRGVEKRKIFMDDQDYAVFLSYLKTYLLPKDVAGLQKTLVDEGTSWRQKDQAKKLLRLNNFADKLVLQCYCLMPNHFHLLVKQSDVDTIDRFMNSLCTRYSMFINKKYHRVGPLFQGIYKAVLVTHEPQLVHLTRYIHRNPASQGQALRSYGYSSYPDYLGLRRTEWVKPSEVLNYFSSSGFNSYRSFVEDKSLNADSLDRIKLLTLDE